MRSKKSRHGAFPTTHPPPRSTAGNGSRMPPSCATSNALARCCSWLPSRMCAWPRRDIRSTEPRFHPAESDLPGLEVPGFSRVIGALFLLFRADFSPRGIVTPPELKPVLLVRTFRAAESRTLPRLGPDLHGKGVIKGGFILRPLA